MKKTQTKTNLIPVLVTTEHKGVFFGYGEAGIPADRVVRIERARMCIYWSADVGGVLGLAASGPSSNCKIGPAVPAITLQAVTSVVEASPEAAAKWDGR
jgi:hypothetical protein